MIDLFSRFGADGYLFALVVNGLAAWRVASFLVRERGPFRVFARLRESWGIIHDEAGHPISWPEGGLGQMLGCIWCVSFWTGLASLGVYLVTPVMVMVAAVAGAAVIVEAALGRFYDEK